MRQLPCVFALFVTILGCANPPSEPRAKLVYFGFDNRAETPENVIRMAKIWGEHPPCPQWRATIRKEEADYEVLFGVSNVTITDRRGGVLYTGGQGVLYLPNGNPDGSGVNICKLTVGDVN